VKSPDGEAASTAWPDHVILGFSNFVLARGARDLLYELLDEQVRFLPGWFKDTLSTASIERLSVLRMDGDMYESTMDALSALYHKVAIGGYVIVDDYDGPPCRQAVTDFRDSHQIQDEIIPIDNNGVFWRRQK